MQVCGNLINSQQPSSFLLDTYHKELKQPLACSNNKFGQNKTSCLNQSWECLHHFTSTLWSFNIAIEAIAIWFLDLPINNGDFPSRVVCLPVGTTVIVRWNGLGDAASAG